MDRSKRAIKPKAIFSPDEYEFTMKACRAIKRLESKKSSTTEDMKRGRGRPHHKRNVSDIPDESNIWHNYRQIIKKHVTAIARETHYMHVYSSDTSAGKLVDVLLRV